MFSTSSLEAFALRTVPDLITLPKRVSFSKQISAPTLWSLILAHALHTHSIQFDISAMSTATPGWIRDLRLLAVVPLPICSRILRTSGPKRITRIIRILEKIALKIKLEASISRRVTMP